MKFLSSDKRLSKIGKEKLYNQNPDGEIKNSGKSIFEIRIPNFCYIQVIFFDFSYLSVAAVGTQQVRYYVKNVKNYNLNVTEVRDSDLKNAFSGIFNFTVGILILTKILQNFMVPNSIRNFFRWYCTLNPFLRYVGHFAHSSCCKGSTA